MALVKADHQLEHVSFTFDDTGQVTDVTLTVNYAVKDDITGAEETRVRKTVSVWETLNSTEKNRSVSLGKLLRALAQST